MPTDGYKEIHLERNPLQVNTRHQSGQDTTNETGLIFTNPKNRLT